MNLVVDTNILVASLSSRSPYHWFIQLILQQKISIFFTDSILFEYEEILAGKYSDAVANDFLTALQELPNAHLVQVYFNWNLLKDEDDNKFLDCYLAANAEYIITNDKDFNILKAVLFPKINILTIEQFRQKTEIVS